MEASFNGMSISYFGSLGPDADIVEVKTIVEGGSGSSRAAKTKQIDNFQLNLNEVSTEPTESTAPLKRLSCASLELGPCRAGRLTALILCGVVWSVWTLPVHDLSLSRRLSCLPDERANDLSGIPSAIKPSATICEELPRHCRGSKRAEKHAPTDTFT